MLLNKRIKALRESANLTQAQLAVILKVSQSAIGNWESGHRTPDAEMLLKIARFFNITVDYLMGNMEFSEIPPQSLTEKENEIIRQYRENQYIRFAIDKLIAEPTVRVFKAAHSTDNTPPGYVDIPKSVMDKLKNAPVVTEI